MNDFRRLFPYIRPNIHLLIVSLLLLVASGALETVVIMLLAPIFNQLSSSAGMASSGSDKFAFLQPLLGLSQNSLVRVAFFLVVFSFFKGIFLYLAEYSMSYSGQQVVAALRKHLNSHLLDQSMAFYAGQPTGKLMARVIADSERLQETVSRILADFFRQALLLLFSSHWCFTPTGSWPSCPF